MRNPKKLEPLRLALVELREMARIEASLGDDSEIAIQKAWKEVQAWADGCARKHKLDLNLPAAQPPTTPLETEGRAHRAAAPPGKLSAT